MKAAYLLMTSVVAPKCAQCSLYTEEGCFCAQLAPDELGALSAVSRQAALQRGETIASRDLKTWPIIAVESGVLSIQHLLEDGRKSIAAFFMPGDILDMRHASERVRGQVIALGKSRICRLSPEVFERITQTNPNAQKVLWNTLRNQSFRAMDHSADLAKKRALEKLASFVFECQRHYTPDDGDEAISIPVRRIDLADYLGMQPETVSRCFRDLEDAGILEFHSLSSIMVKNAPTLRRIANGDKTAGSLVPAGEKSVKILRFA